MSKSLLSNVRIGWDNFVPALLQTIRFVQSVSAVFHTDRPDSWQEPTLQYVSVESAVSRCNDTTVSKKAGVVREAVAVCVAKECSHSRPVSVLSEPIPQFAGEHCVQIWMQTVVPKSVNLKFPSKLEKIKKYSHTWICNGIQWGAVVVSNVGKTPESRSENQKGNAANAQSKRNK